jgi:hypothetical protein
MTSGAVMVSPGTRAGAVDEMERDAAAAAVIEVQAATGDGEVWSELGEVKECLLSGVDEVGWASSRPPADAAVRRGTAQ